MAGVKCRVCDKWFGNRQSLVNHCLAKGHSYCDTCHRAFRDVAALEQHTQESSSHAGPPKAIIPPTSPVVATLMSVEQQVALRLALLNLAIPAPPKPVVCRGNTYTSLSAADANALHAVLLTRCHTPHRLKTQGYVLAADVLTTPPGEAGACVLTPRHDPHVAKRKAIVLDCEMVGTSYSRSGDEVVSLSVIDFFTGETLINQLVKPSRRVTNWRSHITGIKPTAMRVAVSRGEALMGREGARKKLWGHVDGNTVIIGHSVHCDLQALGVVHEKIVDSAILTAEPAFGETKKLQSMAGLERLCRELLGLRIRAERGEGPAASRCHDSLEDVLAAREVVIWCLRHPGELEVWAAKNWAPGKQGKNRTRRRRRNEGRRRDAGDGRESEDEDEDRVVRWEDVVDWDIWPKSPNWSD